MPGGQAKAAGASGASAPAGSVENSISNENVDNLGRVLSKLSMKAIPTWDASNRNEKTIVSHIKSFENATGGAALDGEEKARELIASLRGQALSLVENLGDEQRKDYEELKRTLIEVFHKEKPIQVLIQEFYGMVWRKKKQTIRQYATALNLVWKKIAKDQKGEDKTSEAILKNRLMDGISAAEPKFGEWLQFTTAAETDFNKLAIEAENKYDVFQSTRERVMEHDWENGTSFFNGQKEDDDDQDKSSKGSKRDSNRNHQRNSCENDKRNQNNFFQGQRRNNPNGNSNWQSRAYDFRSQGFDRNDGFDRQWQPRMNQMQNNRWNAYDQEFYQPQGRNFGRRNFFNDGDEARYSDQYGDRYQDRGFQSRSFRRNNWGQNHGQGRYRENGQNRNHDRFQNSNQQFRSRMQESNGTVAERNRNVNFLENTSSKNL